jgi:hypothetical protein
MANLNRTGLVIGGLALAAFLAIGFTLASPARRAAPAPPRPEPVAGGDVASLAAQPHLLFRHAGSGANARRLSVASLDNPDAPFGATNLQCDRIAYARGRGICLRETVGIFSTFDAVLFDSAFRPGATIKLDGTPSRTRISPDGRFGAITVFLTGQAHGYASASFSTKTTLLDMSSGSVIADLEQFHTSRDGEKFSSPDFNFWGVTFSRDSNTFYASLWSAKKTYLVRGDISARAMTVLRENVECPSISPDNRRIAFKKRVGGDLAPWRFYVLDLATLQEHPIAAEARSIDDQIEWFDDNQVLYGAGRGSQSAVVDVWMAPVDGAEPARAFVLQAASAIVVR